jgi:hypothetical protein
LQNSEQTLPINGKKETKEKREIGVESPTN